MHLHRLEFDDAFVPQRGFLQSCVEAGAHVLDARDIAGHVRLWAANDDLQHLQTRLATHFKSDANSPRLCFMGSGDFHHVSALLIEETARAAKEKFTVIHFDNHPDWVRFKGGLHCGSWVNRALAMPEIDRLVTLGVCSNDLLTPERKGAQLSLMAAGRLEIFPYSHGPTRVRGDYGNGASFRQEGRHLHWRETAPETQANFVALILSRIRTDAVYITVDKDVLSTADAGTNWDQGAMPLPWLLGAIEAIGGRHKIVGADVIGDYSPPRYAGSLWRRAVKQAESLRDHCRPVLDTATIAARNGTVNGALLDAFAKVMP